MTDGTNEPARSPRRGDWLRRNHTLLLILFVPVAIGLVSLAVMKVRRIEPPSPADLAYWTAQRFVAEGRYREALHHLGVAMLAEPERLDAALLEARLRLHAGGDAPARIRADLERRLGKEPPEGDRAGALHALLALAWRDSDPVRAAEHAGRAGERPPDTAAGCYYRSVATPHAEEAFAWLEKGLSVDQDSVPCLKASALALHRQRRFDLMNVVLRRADEERPADASTLFLVTLALRDDGDPDAALAVHEEILRLRPEDPEAYRQRSLTHVLRRDLGRAVADAREALRLAPPELRRLYGAHLATMLVAANQWEELEEEFVDAPAETRLEDWLLTGIASRAAFEERAAGKDPKVPEGFGSAPLVRAMADAAMLARTLREKGERLARQASGASFSPDGGRLAFARGVPGAGRIEILDLKSAQVTTPGPDGRDPAWSPDGNLIAFVRQGEAVEWTELTLFKGRTPGIRRGEEVWLMTPAGRNARRLTAGGAPAWSRDSSRVYFHQGALLKSISIDPDRPEETTHLEIPSPLPPSLSPDELLVSTHVRDESRSELQVVRLDTGVAAERWSSPRRDATGLIATWSPSGRELAVSGLPGDELGLWIFDLESRTSGRVLAGDSLRALWSPDGTRLIVEVGAPFWELWSVPLDPRQGTEETLGTVEKVEELFEADVNQLTAAIEARPDDHESYRRRARLYDRLGRFDEAVADYEKAAEGLSDKAVLYYRAARVRHRQGRLRDAVDAYARAIDADPGMPGSYIQRALLYTRVGEDAAALADYEALIGLTDEFGKYRYLAAALCIDGNEDVYDPERAVLLLEKAVELEPRNVDYRLALGRAYRLLDDYRAAIDAVEAAAGIATADSREKVHAALSWWYLMAPEGVRDADKAMTHALTARDLASRKTRHVYENRIGMAHYRQGNLPLAEVVLARALREDPAGGDAYHFLCLAMCNQRLGRADKAKEFFERALAWRERHTPRGAYERRELDALESEARAGLGR